MGAQTPYPSWKAFTAKSLATASCPTIRGAQPGPELRARFPRQPGGWPKWKKSATWADGLPGCDPEHLRLIAQLARITERADTQGATREQHGCTDGRRPGGPAPAIGPGVLWSLVSALRDGAEPDWWYDLIAAVRRQELRASKGYRKRPPAAAGNPPGHADLQSMAERMEQASGDRNGWASTRIP